MADILPLKKSYVDIMIAHARSEIPNECCGILAGSKGKVIKLYRTTNADHSPLRYTVDGRELIAIYQEIEEKGWELLGIYHSHVNAEAYPSEIDIRSAYLPQALYFIISLANMERPVMRAFRIVERQITEVELRIREKGD
jgi:[CysO sulfur-carrier protein]-S-L-cysteine hydrolase